MSLSTTVQSARFNCNGTTGPFTFLFPFTDNAHIYVYLDDTLLTYGVNYTLTGAGTTTGGAVTLITAVASGVLVIDRVVPMTQPTVLANQGPFFAATHEAVFDRLTMLIQQLWDRANRSIRFPKGETSGADINGVEFSSRHGKVLGFNSLGQLALMAVNYVTSSGVLGNPWADARGYASLADAVTALGGTSIDLVVWGNQDVTDNLTIPANIRLVVKLGGTINVTTGKTLTFGTQPVLPLSTVFTGDGSIVGLDVVCPEHFGAVGDSTTACGAEFLKAFQCVVSNTAKLLLHGGYVVDVELESSFKADRLHSWIIEGVNSGSAIIAKIAGGTSGASKKLFKIVGVTSLTEPYGFKFRNFNIYGHTDFPYVDGIYVEHGHMWKAENMEINCNGRSIYIKGSIYPTIRDLRVWTSGATGGSGQPTQQLIYLYGDATYPVNDLIIDNFKCSPGNSAGLTCIQSQNVGANVGITHRIINSTIEGGVDVTGIYYDQPTSGNWEHIHIDKTHIEGVAIDSGYAIFLHSVRHGSIRNTRIGGPSGQIVRLENSIWTPVENSTLIDLVITSDCEYCGPLNCEISNYTNGVTVPKQILSNSASLAGREETVNGAPTQQFADVVLSANGGGTWSGGTLTNLSYKIDNDILHLQIEIVGSTVAAEAGTSQLSFALPAGVTPKFRTWGMMRVIDNGGAAAMGYAEVTASGNIVFYKDLTGTAIWSDSPAATSIVGSISVPVSL